MEITILVILSICGILTWLGLFEVIGEVETFLKRKRELTELQKKSTDIDLYSLRLRLTTELLKTVDSIIETRVLNMIKNLLLVETPYNMLNLSDDVEIIGKEIYNSISEDFLLTENFTLFKPDFLMNYITSQTSLFFTENAKALNLQLYASKNEET